MTVRGKIITFEGGDGCGKDTQMQLMGHYLAERDVDYIPVQEPGGTHWGNACRDLSKHYDGPDKDSIVPLADAGLIFSARVQLYQSLIEPHLSAGNWVIKGRGPISTDVYQGFASGEKREQLAILERLATGGIYVDDFTFILDVPPEVGLAREQNDENCRFSAKDMEFHKEVRRGYLEVARNSPDHVKLVNYIEGEMPEEVHARIVGMLERHLEG